MAQSEKTRSDQRTAAARRAVSQVQELIPGGKALCFIVNPKNTQPPKLRSAIGYSSPEAARDAAAAIEPSVVQLLANPNARNEAASTALGEGDDAIVMPLVFDTRVHGALAVTNARGFDEQTQSTLAEVAAITAARLDHQIALEELDFERTTSADRQASEERTAAELQKLSEALFDRDLEVLRSQERLAEADRFRDDFLVTLSRELRTPIGDVAESLISLLSGEAGNLPEAAIDLVRRALDQSHSLLRALQNVLELRRIRHGEVHVELRDTKFRDIVEGAIYDIQSAHIGRDISIETDLQDPFPTIRTDQDKLSQILTQLVENAVKFTHRGKIVVRGELDGRKLLCEVEDSGIGISADDQPFIFDEFFQVDDAHSTQYHGSGFGLALVQALVKCLDGEIEVRSELGHGTTVAFSIPIEPSRS